VADVDSIAGLIRAKKPGTSSIIASAVADRNIKGAAALVVNARP
jgi:hypothetical protein